MRGREDRIRRHDVVLRALKRVNNATRIAIIANAKKDLIDVLVACAKAIIKGQVDLTPQQSRAIRQRAQDITELVKSGNSLTRKRSLLQRGGLLPALLGPALSILPELLGGVLGGRR